MKKSIILACAVSAISTGAIADRPSDFEAYLGGAKYIWDQDRSLDDSTALEAGAELPFTENLSMEAWLSKADADRENSPSELEGMRYSLGGLYHFSNDDLNQKSVRPFISFGGAQQNFEDSSNNKHSEALVYLGAGLKKYFDNNIVLRGELQASNSLDHEVTDLGVKLAIGYAFGRKAPSSTKVTENLPKKPVTQMSSEEETVHNDTKEPMEKEQPVVQKVEKKVKTVVTPIDSDQDGVIDELDKCKDTNAAFKVDEAGCPIMLTEKVSITMNVTFASNSAAVPAQNMDDIKKVADFMKQFAKTNVTIEGHSDDRGRAAYNKMLSQKRADAVRQTLIDSFNIDPNRMTSVGYGEERPIADNNTVEGRAENRRVVAVVESSLQKPTIK